LSETEFIVLFTIADRVLDGRARIMRRFKGDDCELYDRICQVAGVERSGLKDVLARLAARGLDVRVVYKHDRNGRPIYACKGHAMDFRFPDLPASVRLAEPAEACG
jgi:hypothetical protein